MARMDDDEALDRFDERLRLAVDSLDRFQQEFGHGKLNRMISTSFRKEEKRLQRELNGLVKSALKQSLGELGGGLGGKGTSSVIDALFGFIPGFARGGVLSRRTRLAHVGESGPEAVLPLKKTRDGRLGVTVEGGAKQGGASQAAPIHITISNPDPQLTAALRQHDPEAVEAALSREIDSAIDDRIRAHIGAGGIPRKGGLF